MFRVSSGLTRKYSYHCYFKSKKYIVNHLTSQEKYISTIMFTRKTNVYDIIEFFKDQFWRRLAVYSTPWSA